MAKFTRTAYASGSLRETARQIAAYAGLEGSLSVYNDVHQHKAAGRKRVRITILVEPEAPPPKAARKPRRPRPVQLALEIPAPGTCEEQDMGGTACPGGQCAREGTCSAQVFTGDGRETRFLVPASAVLGGA